MEVQWKPLWDIPSWRPSLGLPEFKERTSGCLEWCPTRRENGQGAAAAGLYFKPGKAGHKETRRKRRGAGIGDQRGCVGFPWMSIQLLGSLFLSCWCFVVVEGLGGLGVFRFLCSRGMVGYVGEEGVWGGGRGVMEGAS